MGGGRLPPPDCFYEAKLSCYNNSLDMINYSMLSKAKKKYFICFPKWASGEFEEL